MTTGDTRMRIALVAMLLAAGTFCAPARAADLAAGKEKAELCITCHGEGGISETEKIPSLAGQPDLFIQWQLVFFRAGTRKSEEMQPVVEPLNNEDIRNLGAYFASLAPARARRPPRAGVATGAIPTLMPAAKRCLVWPASARTIC